MGQSIALREYYGQNERGLVQTTFLASGEMAQVIAINLASDV